MAGAVRRFPVAGGGGGCVGFATGTLRSRSSSERRASRCHAARFHVFCSSRLAGSPFRRFAIGDALGTEPGTAGKKGNARRTGGALGTEPGTAGKKGNARRTGDGLGTEPGTAGKMCTQIRRYNKESLY